MDSIQICAYGLLNCSFGTTTEQAGLKLLTEDEARQKLYTWRPIARLNPAHAGKVDNLISLGFQPHKEEWRGLGVWDCWYFDLKPQGFTFMLAKNENNPSNVTINAKFNDFKGNRGFLDEVLKSMQLSKADLEWIDTPNKVW